MTDQRDREREQEEGQERRDLAAMLHPLTRALVAAEREFAEFMENLRHARDREEFERFMDAHRNQQARQ